MTTQSITETDTELLPLPVAAAVADRAPSAALSRSHLQQWWPAIDLLVAAVVLLVPLRAAGSAPSAAALGLVGLTWALALGLSGAWSAHTRGDRLRAVPRAAAILGVGCWVAEAAWSPAATPAQLVAATAALMLATLLPRLLAQGLASTRGPTRVVLVGDGPEVHRLLGDLRAGPRSRWDVAAVCMTADGADDAAPLDASAEGVAIWIGVDTATDAARAARASAVVLAPGRDLDPSSARRLGWAAHAAGLDVYVGTGLLDVGPRSARLVPAGTAGLLRLRHATSPSAARGVKELLDRVGAALVLLLLLPLMGIIALLIRRDSPGPAIFRQQRVGRDGVPFTMYKFRTMSTGAAAQVDGLLDHNEGSGVLFKMRQDPRVTRVGTWVRRYSLDELPQLVNVLLGQMSLVGPRPALPGEVERYDVDPRHRLVVKPGLTGLWQVSGRSDLTWAEAVRLDLHYVDHWSLRLDAVIVLRTVSAVLAHRGAY
ncbi:exopolysaccharide biosynthesis polyprenyl glycosylphosphotransferase [Nocardioides sp. URHA0020]|uniref:exopolysaccharide biosynthesis polyprenyl glycosylphosphotransferase n=1 Tax=Nocardioides sp. URHA0020 TaxID=1380392 RepID=UPI000568F4A9|nr:exopolysaccharide biosynthesis polyprenyl glycosylphosphotransferase [Nocardioides sp. URHA0020]